MEKFNDKIEKHLKLSEIADMLKECKTKSKFEPLQNKTKFKLQKTIYLI